MLLGFARLDRLAVKIEGFVLGYSGLAVLTNDDGLVLACSDPSLIGQQISATLGGSGRGKDEVLTDRLLGTSGDYCLVAQRLSHSVLPAGESWRVLVGQRRAEILESSSNPVTWSLITVIVITPLVLILGLLFTSSVRRSLECLITATRKIANGDFTAQPIDRPYWEIGELAKTFEEMQDSLAKSTRQNVQYQKRLEDMVSQKTRELQDSEEKFRTIYESCREALILIGLDKKLLSGNPAAVRMFGCKDERDFASKTLDELLPERQPDGALSSKYIEQMISTVMKRGFHSFEGKLEREDNTEFFASVSLTCAKLDGRTVLQAAVGNITERKHLEEMLIERAQIDPLTELWNRRALSTRLRQEWSRRQRYGSGGLVLIMSDIDHFKSINDTYGHQVGDEILRQIAKVFLGHCRESDFPTRYGGEEFALVLPGTDAEGAANLAERCRLEIEGIVLNVGECTVKVTASFGIADASDLPSVDVLISRADEALYQAKSAGRNRVILAGHTQGAIEPDISAVRSPQT